MKKVFHKTLTITAFLFGLLLTACMDETVRAEFEARSALADGISVITENEVTTSEATELSELSEKTTDYIFAAADSSETEVSAVVPDVIVSCETFVSGSDNYSDITVYESDAVTGEIMPVTATIDYGNITDTGLPVAAEEIIYNQDENSLYVRFRNDTGHDLEHVFNLALYSNGNLLNFKDDFGFCGTPDSFPAGRVFEMSYPLDSIYGELTDGYYSFSVNFDVSGSMYDGMYTVNDGFRIGESSGEILYDVNYLDDGDIEIKYKNDTDEHYTYGLLYELVDNDGNNVPFLDNAAVIAIACVMYPGGENRLPLNIEFMFGNLPHGEYTVLHELWGNTDSVIMEIPIIIN